MQEESNNERSLPEILLSIESSNKTIIQTFENFAANQQNERKIHHLNVYNLTKDQKEFIEWRNTLNQELTEILSSERAQIDTFFKDKVSQLHNIKVGLYEPTQNNINRLEKFIKKFWVIPLYILLASVITTGITTYLAINFYKESINSKQEIISEYRTELLKKNAIVSKENNDLLSDMVRWFEKNPNTKDIFVKSRDTK